MQAITQRFPSLLRVTSNGDTRSDAASTMSPVSTDATASYGSGSGVAGKSTKTPAGNAARFAAGKKQVSGLQAGASTVPSSPVHLPLSPMPHQDLLQRYAPASAAAPGGAGALHGNAARLTLQLLVYKKMLAWDLLLSSSASEDMLLAGLGLVLCSNDMNDT